MRMRWVAWLLAIGCSGTNGGTQASAETGSATTGMGSTGSGTTATNPSSTVGATTEDPPTGDPGTDATATGGASSSDGGESSTGEPPIQFCGLEDLKPGAPNPIVSGTEPMMIPPDIAEVLLDNCGCHYADMLTVHAPDYSTLLPLRIDTWEQWQGTYGFPGDISPTLDGVLGRVQGAREEITMPHNFCNVGDGEHMDPTARELLIEWITAGGPDGATWMP